MWGLHFPRGENFGGRLEWNVEGCAARLFRESNNEHAAVRGRGVGDDARSDQHHLQIGNSAMQACVELFADLRGLARCDNDISGRIHYGPLSVILMRLLVECRAGWSRANL